MPLLDAVAQAWRESVFAPGRFYGQLGREQSMWPSLGYYLALGILVAGVTLFWEMVLPADGVFGAPGIANLRSTAPLLDFLFSPLVLLLGLLVGGGVVHVMLLLFGGAKNGFGTTLRVFCFSYGPALFAVVPVIGQIIGSFWMFVLSIIGLREAHGTSTARAAAAVILPTLVLLFLAILAALVLRIGGMTL